MKKKLAKRPKTTSSDPSELPTFLEHVYELRRRLFWIIAVVLFTSAAAYPFLDQIISLVTEPLGGQQLYYLTPVGGFSFSIKICFYVGIILAVPIIMYHLYRFLEPLMGKKMQHSAVFYVGFSTALAITGVLFAYYLALPGALRFLTGIDLNNIQAMLTVDSYLTFVMTYLIGSAFVFQIPLLLIVINTMTPLDPGKLMKAQRYVIVVAFVAAAVISPTPDVMNQAIFALPMIAMYELGVIIVWSKNSSAKRAAKKAQELKARTIVKEEFRRPLAANKATVNTSASASACPVVSCQDMVVRRKAAQNLTYRKPVDGFVQKSLASKAASTTVRCSIPKPAPRVDRRRITVPTRSVDGFAVRRSQQFTETP